MKKATMPAGFKTWSGGYSSGYSRELLAPFSREDLRDVLAAVYGRETVTVQEIIASLHGLTDKDAAVIRERFAFSGGTVSLNELAAFIWRRSNMYEDEES